MTGHVSFIGHPGALVQTVRLYALALALILSGVIAPHPATANEDIPFPVKEVAPGVFVYEAPIALADEGNLGAIANLGFIIGRDGVAVIDTGGSLAAGRRLFKAIRQRTDQPIRYVINTHMHPDHVLGNAAFSGSSVTFIGHRNLPRSLKERERVYLTANGALIGTSFKGTEVIPPSFLVEHDVELDLGDRRLRVEAWRTAHTSTDVTVLDLETDTWFLGDLLFIDHVPALDGSLAGWIRLLSDLRLRPAARVVPGHGPLSIPWPGAATPTEQYLMRLQADVRSLIRQGGTISEATRQAAQSEASVWMLFNEFNPRNATTAFHELEWE
jgi:quinoprotein relay system zinc metallohydrolase 2